jgi:hypothetical protein
MQRAHDTQLRLGRGAQRPGAHRDHDIEADVQGTRSALDERIARERGFAWLVAAQHLAPTRLELGGRLLDRPIVRADD